MRATVPSDGRGRKEMTGRHVLLILVAFFGVVFAVNGVFLTKALFTYTGVVSQEPYVKGLQYNARIAAGERQAKLGWHDAASVSIDGAIAATLIDPDGRPVRNLVLEGTIGRAATSRLDRTVTLRETEPGRYVASVGPLETGTWVLSLEARGADWGAEPVYRMRRRIWVKQ
ncbi:MAG: FixH family protein [Hyphomicrobiaceae bacterium]|nr:FixH family protein [Hyphomicrobiaceae bacterium]